MGSSVSKIYIESFTRCSSLLSVKISGFLKLFHFDVFSLCISLKCISFDGIKQQISGYYPFRGINSVSVHVPTNYLNSSFYGLNINKDVIKCQSCQLGEEKYSSTYTTCTKCQLRYYQFTYGQTTCTKNVQQEHIHQQQEPIVQIHVLNVKQKHIYQ